MPSVSNMETKSPWSTPTESEILNAEDSALIKEKEDALFEEIDYTVNETFGKRELGDGEPSVDENLDGRQSTLPPSPTKSKSKKGLKNGVKERGRQNRSKSPASNKTRQKSISPTKKKRSPKIAKKKMILQKTDFSTKGLPFMKSICLFKIQKTNFKSLLIT